MPRALAKCLHGNFIGKCGFCPERFFKEKHWVEGWALDAYTKRNGRSENGELVNVVKYCLHNQPIEASVKAEILLLRLLEFLVKIYPIAYRPFDTLVHPPSNTKREFHLTHFIADRLAGPNMINRSSEIVKSKPHVTVKTMSGKERVKTLHKSMQVIPNQALPKPKGILIIDDVLGTGNTAKETCRALQECWPNAPRYYVSLTYLLDWDNGQ
jgi:predicted amidophosphoribosyltransferase